MRFAHVLTSHARFALTTASCALYLTKEGPQVDFPIKFGQDKSQLDKVQVSYQLSLCIFLERSLAVLAAASVQSMPLLQSLVFPHFSMQHQKIPMLDAFNKASDKD